MGGSGSMSLAAQTTKKPDKDFTEAERAAIVDECTVELYSPILLAEKYNINVTLIRGWVKAAGKNLPQKYMYNAIKPKKKLREDTYYQCMRNGSGKFMTNKDLDQNLNTDHKKI